MIPEEDIKCANPVADYDQWLPNFYASNKNLIVPERLWKSDGYQFALFGSTCPDA